MDSQIKKLFLLQIVVFILLIFIISIFTLTAIANRSTEEAVFDRFEYELSLVTNQFYTNVSMAIENVKALSSRTMIKNELFHYLRGEELLAGKGMIFFKTNSGCNIFISNPIF